MLHSQLERIDRVRGWLLVVFEVDFRVDYRVRLETDWATPSRFSVP